MRRVGLLFALAPIGCAKLNPAYGDESANGSRGGDTTAAEAEAETGQAHPIGLRLRRREAPEYGDDVPHQAVPFL